MRCSVLPPQSNFIRKATVCLLSFIPICAESEAVGMVIIMNSGLRAYNEQNKLAQWVQIVSECRDSGMSVRQWCQEHDINISSYYRWQRKVYAMVQAQQEVQFAEVTPVQAVCTDRVAVTIRIHGMEADIHSGADAATVETVLRVLQSC